MDQEDLKNDAKVLQSYFSKDNRFVWIKPIAEGGFGTAHRLQYRYHEQNGTINTTDFIVKKAQNSEEARKYLRNERRHLEMLQGGMHIVRTINIPDNPLTTNKYDAEWLFLEWLPNGEFEDFVYKAKLHKVKRLPNRLLWRFFLCFIRGACGLAWPRNRQDGLLELEVPQPYPQTAGIMHNDIHGRNVLLGDFEIGEHGISPILKLIDFGTSDRPTPNERDNAAVENNLWGIGKLMVQLITLDYNWEEDEDNPGIFDFVGNTVSTQADAIVAPYIGAPRPHPWLDDWLETLVAMCMTLQGDKLPSLEHFTTYLQYAVVERNAAFYNDPMETDGAIKELCQRIMNDAPV